MKRIVWLSLVVLALPALLALAPGAASAQSAAQYTATDVPGEPPCPGGGSIVKAYVVALDQALTLNRMGAEMTNGMMFALARDVFPKGTKPADETELNSCRWAKCTAGNVQLRSTKRPRPLVLRVNEGQCLRMVYSNLLSPADPDGPDPMTSLHVQGVDWVTSSLDDGSWVGNNPSSLVATNAPVKLPPNGQHVYTLFAARQGSFLLYSAADAWTQSANSGAATKSDGGTLALGLFGAVNVQPAGAEWYRSQVTEQDLCRASRDKQPSDGACVRANPGELPKIDYRAEDAFHIPVLNLLACEGQAQHGCPKGGEVVHSDLTALITGREPDGNPGNFPKSSAGAPVFNPAYSEPDRRQPWREFTILYHELFNATQAFPKVYTQVLQGDGTGADNFAFNYGSGGIGSEILSNRFGVGPASNCPGCKYEEFFLASWALGDPAMVVDNSAQSTCTWSSSNLTYDCTGNNPATVAYYPDDPSNVYHSYMEDHTKFQILHAGVDLHHLHHQHAHQWLHSPDTPNGDYTDSQSLGPGSSFTLEMVYNGSGNVNQTVGDSIFHCHFYPHFAMGMWSLWRVHDVFESGTRIDPGTGKPMADDNPNRVLPDGEIVAGTPIPALVPLPTRPMAPLPAPVRLAKDSDGKEIEVQATDGTWVSSLAGKGDPSKIKNPGYPFFIPGVAGQRGTHPPMDFAYACTDTGQQCTPPFGGQKGETSQCGSPDKCQPLDGGLPRHLLLACDGAPDTCADTTPLSTQDFSKVLLSVPSQKVPEEGTVVEQAAMATHAQREHKTVTPEGKPAEFTLNGLPPRQGAPYADPCINFSREGGVPANLKTRRYKAADVQLDVSFNKQGWHYPQERMLSLWGDVSATLKGERPPEPLFFRANSGECIEYTHANLVPNVFELDDFEVRTPTDILGQHIHLVKFDVTSSDGAGNGWNYEDGTFAPNEVLERILAIRKHNGCDSDHPAGAFCPVARTLPFFGPGPGGQWVGAQATIQRWYADPLFDGPTNPPAKGAKDRTLRTVFTHDHFGPSTHQQAGLYAGLVIEPKGSNWYANDSAGADGKADKLLGGVNAQGDPLVVRTIKGYNGKSIPDGGPTSWQALIMVPSQGTEARQALIEKHQRNESYREFLFQVQDSALMYEKFTNVTPPASLGQGFCVDDPATQCTPATVKNYDTDTDTGCKTGPCVAYGFCANDFTQKCAPSPWEHFSDKLPACTGGATCNLIPGIPAACNGCTSPPPEAAGWNTSPINSVKGAEVITYSNAGYNFLLNYRSEPLFQRINTGSTAANASDVSFVYSSTVDRGSGLSGDPATLLLRSYAGDDVQVRTLLGGHINPHNFTIFDVKWLAEPAMTDSGWRNSQVMGISEHFEEVFRLPSWVSPKSSANPGVADYLYMGGAAAIEQASGNWGLLRAYGQVQKNLPLLPQNPEPGKYADVPVCPPSLKAPYQKRTYTVVALTAQQALGGALTYNQRGDIIDPNAILYYKLEDLSCATPSTSCAARSKTPAPLVLRANAGDCIEVTLYNEINLTTPLAGAPNPVFTDLTSNTSLQVGLHPQLVTYDVTQSSGFNAGLNPTQTVAQGEHKTYKWYAGNVDVAAADPARRYIPIEFGAANLLPSDVFNHYQHGLFGALVIEPEGATGWKTTDGVTAVVQRPKPLPQGQAFNPNQLKNELEHAQESRAFREFVLITQDGLAAYPPTEASAPTTLQPQLSIVQYNALNYRVEPFIYLDPNQDAVPVRWCASSDSTTSCTPPEPVNATCSLSSKSGNGLVPMCCTEITLNSGTASCSACAPCKDPETPILQACAGEQVRMRLLHAGGANTQQVFELFGHSWAETPYMSTGRGCIPPTTQTNLYSSSIIGDNHLCIASLLGSGGYTAPFAEYGRVRDSLTDWQGSRMGHGPSNHFDILIGKAGGEHEVPGDYLYRSYPGMQFRLGPWGLFRVLSSDQAKEAQLQCIKSK